jgi:hypothetical protein
MSLPGFLAERSLYPSEQRYRASGRYEPAKTESTIQQQACEGASWGQLKFDHCTGRHKSQHSAILWDIPWGDDWEDCCQQVPYNRSGTFASGRTPDRCVHSGFHIWGQWDNYDNPSCW